MSLRKVIGATIREERKRQKLSLRDMCDMAYISLGYISEVERGKKEASSETLSHICAALNYPMPTLLRKVADEMEGIHANTNNQNATVRSLS